MTFAERQADVESTWREHRAAPGRSGTNVAGTYFRRTRGRGTEPNLPRHRTTTGGRAVSLVPISDGHHDSALADDKDQAQDVTVVAD